MMSKYERARVIRQIMYHAHQALMSGYSDLYKHLMARAAHIQKGY